MPLNKKMQLIGLVALVALVLSLFLQQALTKEVMGVSPTFARQTFTDNADDWSYMSIDSSFPFDEKECAAQRENLASPDISAIDYFSDGKSLNATLWLSSYVRPPNASTITSFEMLIDVNSVYDTGQDYWLKFQWDNIKKSWIRILQDISPSPGKNKIIDSGEFRILENQSYNAIDFYEEGKNYVELNLELQSISSPDQYSLVFMASNSFYTQTSFCNAIDISDRVHIPPPDTLISMTPSSLALRPDEQESIELRLKSSTKLDSHIVLLADNHDAIDSKFTPSEVALPSTGLAVSQLQIKADKNAEPGIFTLPIAANVTFPTTLINQRSGQVANNSVSATIVKHSNFTVTILKAVTPSEQFGNIWKELGTPLSGFISLTTAIIGGISTAIVYMLKRRKVQQAKDT